MKKLDQIEEAYFIGIGGIGMSAIARYFRSKGKNVSGYDKTETDLTRQLEKEGIKVHYKEDVDSIPRKPDLVVFTPAIPDDHKELNFYRSKGFDLLKRSDVLRIITESSFNICVAGTHGKTTITTMIAHLLRDTGYGCNAFLGGISSNYDTNFWTSDKNVVVVEADEYDRSFLKLSPNIAVITAMDPDHLDIYGTKEAMEQAFIDFSGRIREDGTLVKQFGLKRGAELKATRKISYSLQNSAADAHAEWIKMDEGSYDFDLKIGNDEIKGLRLNMGGMHNVENAIAAITVAQTLGIDQDKIKKSISSFKGVKRRFEYVIRNRELVFIDDYAHHPEELRALISGAKALFRQRRCTVIFQPHLYTRTRDLADGFAEVLDMADEIILLPIYPARELPIKGVNSGMIMNRMKNDHKELMEKDELLDWIEKKYKQAVHPEFGGVLITAGAGDIDALVEPIKNKLSDLV